MKNCLWVLCFVPFFAGCLPQVANMSNNYTDNDVYKRKVLLIAPPIDSVSVANKDDVEDDFSNTKDDARVVLRSAFYNAVAANLHKLESMQNAHIFEDDTLLELSVKDTANLLCLHYTIDKGKIPLMFYLPKKEWLTAHGKTPDIAIVITTLAYGRNVTFSSGAGHYMPGVKVSTPTGSYTTGGMFIGGGGGASSLDGSFSFLIYDYKKDTWINYGIPKVSFGIPIWGLTRGGWNSTFEEATDKLLANSPWESLTWLAR